MLSWSLIFLGSIAWLSAAQPIDSDATSENLLRVRRSPIAARTMILIRGQPSNVGYQYERPERAFHPHASMSAYAAGGTVAAGSFYRPPSKQKCGNCNKLVDEQPDANQPEGEKVTPAAPEEEVPAPPADEPEPEVVQTPERTPKVEKVPERTPKAERAPERTPLAEKAPEKPKRSQTVDDDDDDDDVSVGSVYRNFFPIVFGGGPSGGRDAGAEGGQGGGATAIANSFSKGRGAVASSVATANGNPDTPAQTRQGQPSRYRS